MRKLIALLSGVLLAGAGVLPAMAATAATSITHPRITTLLASSQWIVYRQKTTSTNIRPEFLVGGSLYATDLSGQLQSLPGFDNEKQFLSLTGSTLVQAQNQVHTNTERQTIRWRNLNNHATGTAQTEPGAVLEGAAPDGWIEDSSSPEDSYYGNANQLTYVHFDGTRVDLGKPFPKGQFFGLTISDTGILATPGTSDEFHFKSQVRYLPWSHAAAWRTLYTTPVSKTIGCAPSSSRYAACEMSPADTYTGTTTYGLIALDGSGARWIQTTHPKACKAVNIATLGANLVAVETSSAGVCTKGTLFRFSWEGALVSGGSHHYSSTGIQVGLGGVSGGTGLILVSSLEQRHIDTLTGVTRSPYVVARV